MCSSDLRICFSYCLNTLRIFRIILRSLLCVRISLVPLGTLLLAGPGAIVAAMVAVESSGGAFSGWIAVGAAVLVAHLVIWLTLRFSMVLNRLLRDSGITLLTRIAGLLLAAIAVQMVADAVFAFIAQEL